MMYRCYAHHKQVGEPAYPSSAYQKNLIKPKKNGHPQEKEMSVFIYLRRDTQEFIPQIPSTSNLFAF